ncbi:AAA family ATPase [Geodermatophilus sp. SYSU D00700]
MLSLAPQLELRPNWSRLTNINARTPIEILVEENDRPVFVMDGMIHAASTLVYGPPKVGKTGLVVQLVRAVASGESWQGHTVQAARSVLILASDGGGRIEYARRLGSSASPCVAVAAPPDWRNESAWTRLAGECAAEDVGLVVLDNLLSWAKQADITENAQVGTALANLDKVLDHGLPLVVVHHTPKNSGDRPSGNTSIEAYFRHLVLVKDGWLTTSGNEVPRIRRRLSYDEQGLIEGVGDPDPGKPRHSGRRPEAQNLREAAHAALRAAGPEVLVSISQAKRHVAHSLPGVRSEHHAKQLIEEMIAVGWLTTRGSGRRGTSARLLINTMPEVVGK